MQVALFPLNTVLFPQGALPLRIFEARYMDMARDCLRDNLAFGVVLISRGSEVGAAAATESVGTLATITGWDMPQFGVLNVRCLGGQRFRIADRTVQTNGLITAQVQLVDHDLDTPLAEEHKPCAELLSRIIEDIKHSAEQTTDPAAQTGQVNPALAAVFEPPYLLESTVWVGNRLCEVLPVPLKAKQKLMELEDGYSRLDIVNQYLKQHAVFK